MAPILQPLSTNKEGRGNLFKTLQIHVKLAEMMTICSWFNLQMKKIFYCIKFNLNFNFKVFLETLNVPPVSSTILQQMSLLPAKPRPPIAIALYRHLLISYSLEGTGCKSIFPTNLAVCPVEFHRPWDPVYLINYLSSTSGSVIVIL